MDGANITVSGLVQGVGFRYMTRRLAKKHALKGKVENLEDETVRIVCEGKKTNIEGFADAIRRAPEPVEVDDIHIEYVKPTGMYQNFTIVMGDMLKEMVEGHATGAVYLDFILQKQDQMLGKQDQMLGKQDQMLGKQDQMLGKQEETITEIRTLSSSIRNTMDSRFQRLEDEIIKIKTKLSI